MLPLNILLQHSLFYGAILSLFLTALVIISLIRWPMIWVGDLPEDVKAVVPPMSARDKRIRLAVAGVMFAGIAAALIASLVGLWQLSGGSPSFTEVAISVFVIAMTFNLVDLLLIDWLLVVKIRPSFVMVPGTEHMAGYDDYGFHFRGFLKGTVGIFLFSLIVAALVVLIF